MRITLKNKAHLEKLLREGNPSEENPYPSQIKTSIWGNSTHKWWIDENNELHCYGSGQGWSDQTSEIRDGRNLEKHLKELWKRRRDINKHLNDEY